MPTYERPNFEEMAAAIRVEVTQVAEHESQLESAALWYQLNGRRPTRIAPSKLREKLNQVAKSGRRLLKNLGIKDASEAADGPCDRELLIALVLAGEPNEDPVVEATRRVGRFQEIMDGVLAAAEFECRATQGVVAVAEVGKLTMREGNPGDDAVNDWAATMMSIYRSITGKEPATSVGAEASPMRGLPGGLSFGSCKPRPSR